MYDILIVHPLLGNAVADMPCYLPDALELIEEEKSLRSILGIGLDCKVFLSPIFSMDTSVPMLDLGGW